MLIYKIWNNVREYTYKFSDFVLLWKIVYLLFYSILKYTYGDFMRAITQTSGLAVTTLKYDKRDRVTSKVVKNSTGTKFAQENYAYTINTTGLLTTVTVQGDANACTYTTAVQTDVLGRTGAETNRQGGLPVIHKI